MLQRTDAVSDHLASKLPSTASSPEDGDQSSEFRVQSSEFRVQSSEFRVQSSEFRVRFSVRCSMFDVATWSLHGPVSCGDIRLILRRHEFHLPI